MKTYKFKAVVNGEEIHPKGFYYQGKFVVLVGCEKTGHTIRRKERIEDVTITITEHGRTERT